MPELRPVVAMLDASVLYPAAIRNLLMYLAIGDVFHARWSEDIHREWIGALLRNRPDLDPRRLERTRSLMATHIPDAMVVGYQPLIESITLPDPGDRHVLAAAIRGGAQTIVTLNLKHFPAATLAAHGIAARHPDAFVADLLDLNPDAAIKAIRRHRQSLSNPAQTVAEYLTALTAHGLPETEQLLHPFSDVL